MVTQETPAGSGNQRTRYLKIENITKKFGEFVALHDISLDIYEGEFICFLGPSGCGKTTLLRAIAGLDIQTSGRIEQGGKDISNLPAAERNFGIVFQSYALFPNLTVSKNVGYGLVNQRMGKAAIRERVAELLDLVGLSDQGSKYPAQLSGGEQQRVALPAPWPPRPACCSSTSRCRRLTPRSASFSARRSRRFTAGSASPPSWSHTTRKRR